MACLFKSSVEHTLRLRQRRNQRCKQLNNAYNGNERQKEREKHGHRLKALKKNSNGKIMTERYSRRATNNQDKKEHIRT